MFERRLKVVLVILSAVVVVLLCRAAQLQVLQREYWRQQAADALKKVRYTETIRGAILDRKGNVLAEDRPCVDVCVDYRAIVHPADDKWVKDVAGGRLRARMGEAWERASKKQREHLRDVEADAVRKDIDDMWAKLADVSGDSREEIEQTRQSILQRVEMRKKYVWYHNYQQAMKNDGDASSAETESKWEKWLSGESSDAPEIDKFAVTVADEEIPHVVVHAISLEVQNELGRHQEKYPGLVLRPGTHRYYPFDDVACHVVGHIGRVNHDDVIHDLGRFDPRRKYLLNDLIGRSGLEWLCEPALRGTLGRVVTVEHEETPANSDDPPIPGEAVHSSIDVELQEDIQNFFASATLHDNVGNVVERGAVLHGAAVLLDVKTNEVLALVSYPTYNLNLYDQKYKEWDDDEVNDPLRDRATESQLEPGSTVKPLVGLSGLTQGVIKVNEGIECTGYLILPNGHGGVTRYARSGRCWVASTPAFVQALRGQVAHHPIPRPHRGHDGNPDGWLTYSDALERSCNVYFETVADKLGTVELSNWMRRFGLGRRTGIGIEEYKGWVPGDAPRSFARERERSTCYLGGIGQGYVAATPIQMANIAATIARNGIWMRPRLIRTDPESHKMPTPHAGALDGPDVVDLHLDPEAVKACKLGMTNVVNAESGTGKGAHMDDLLVAGKTGTAQAAEFKLLIHDPREKKKPILDENGKRQYKTFALSTPMQPNKDMPWYRGSGPPNFDKIDHAWMIGFAPADDPKIAFAALVEYGGSGGGAAADVVRASLEACMAHNYLQPKPRAKQPEQQARATDEREARVNDD